MSAALSILLDPASHHRSAQGHLLAAWRCAHAASKDTDHASDALTSWVEAHAEPLADGERRRAASVLTRLVADEAKPLETRGDAISARELVANARALGRVLASGDAPQSLHGAMSGPWLWRVIKVGAVLILAGWFLVTIREKDDLGQGAWRGDYYPTHTYEGKPILRRDRDINFSWGSSPPHERISADKFSVRWDTCVEVSKPTNFVFDLRSNDGSRLFVDGSSVIDVWNVKGNPHGTAEVELAPGVHHLQLDYFEMRGSASVRLRASIDGQKPDALPTSILRYPGNQLNTNDPCGQAGG